MDEIYTSAEALRKADKTLRVFNERLAHVLLNSEARIREQFDGIDTNYQNELVAYFEELRSLQKQMGQFEAHNSEAIRDRLNKLSEYTATTYVQRNIL